MSTDSSLKPIDRDRASLRAIYASLGVGHFIIAILIFFALSYILGRQVLVGPVGNDSPLHIANTEWFDQFLPDIPNWFPLHGGGMSIQRSYPIMSYLIVAAVNRILDSGIVHAYRLVGFFSIPLAAGAIYILARGALRSKTIGLIAGVLFVLSPVSWSWIFEQGYIATTLAVVGLPIALLAFIRLVESSHEDDGAIATRLWFVLLAVSLAAVAVTHAVVAASAIAGIGFYFVFQLAVGEYGYMVKPMIKSVKVGLIAGLAAGALAAYWLIPVVNYGRVADREGLNTYAPSSIPQPSLAELFSYKSLESLEWGWFQNSSLPVVLGILFIAGIVTAVLLSRRALALGLVGIATIFYLLTPEIAINLLELWPMWPLVFRTRSFVVLASVIFPVVAGFGCWGIGKLALIPLGAIRKRIALTGSPLGRTMHAFERVAIAVLAVFVAAASVYYFRSISAATSTQINYGLSRHGFNASDVWGVGSDSNSILSQLAPENWPEVEIATDDGALALSRKWADILPTSEFLRIDISPFRGRIAQSLPLYANASQMNTYIFNGNLNHALWAYQVNVFFEDSPPESEYGTPAVLNEAAKWFGIDYVYLRPDQDPVWMYDSAGWSLIHQESGLEIRKSPNQQEYVSVAARPLVLVISQEDVRGYEQVFRAANKGMLPYDQAWLVQGHEQVDSYSAEELGQFDAVIMHGYSYRNSVRAWAILEEYVREGGSLYVDTGWQWTVPEWEFLHTPQVLPISTLKWTNYGMNSEYGLEAPDITGDHNVDNFAPLVWENGPWSLSGAQRSDIREWGRPVLTANGMPLVVAGEYGEGKVVWSGMNLISHANDNGSDEEFSLLRGLMGWLAGETNGETFTVVATRDHPDKVEFELGTPTGENTTLLWKESYYPAWKAHLIDEAGDRRALEIFRGGPGFMLIPFGETPSQATIELVWRTPLIEHVATIISLLTAGLLAFVVIDSVAFGGRWVTTILAKRKALPQKERPKGRIAWLDEPSSVDLIAEVPEPTETRAAPLTE